MQTQNLSCLAFLFSFYPFQPGIHVCVYVCVCVFCVSLIATYFMALFKPSKQYPWHEKYDFSEL